jgi:hypothetical protein
MQLKFLLEPRRTLLHEVAALNGDVPAVRRNGPQ